MLPEAGVLELAFLAAVALIVVGPKDLPVLLRKVGQFTAKMRGLAAEFRASFDEMARQSELDELRKEVEALRTGQFASSTTAAIDAHAGEINDHLSHNYWDGAAQADPSHAFDPMTGEPMSEAAETAALPPPGSRTPPLPKPSKKLAAARKATGVAEPDLEPAPKPAPARRAKSASAAKSTTAAKTSTSAKAATAAKPPPAKASSERPAKPAAAKAVAPASTSAAKPLRKRVAKAPLSTEVAEI